MSNDYILFPEDKEKMDDARRKHCVSASFSNELLCCEKDSVVMAACPSCKGLHFNIIRNGEAQCASMTKDSVIGCGWAGKIKT